MPLLVCKVMVTTTALGWFSGRFPLSRCIRKCQTIQKYYNRLNSDKFNKLARAMLGEGGVTLKASKCFGLGSLGKGETEAATHYVGSRRTFWRK